MTSADFEKDRFGVGLESCKQDVGNLGAIITEFDLQKPPRSGEIVGIWKIGKVFTFKLNVAKVRLVGACCAFA